MIRTVASAPHSRGIARSFSAKRGDCLHAARQLRGRVKSCINSTSGRVNKTLQRSFSSSATFGRYNCASLSELSERNVAALSELSERTSTRRTANRGLAMAVAAMGALTTTATVALLEESATEDGTKVMATSFLPLHTPEGFLDRETEIKEYQPSTKTTTTDDSSVSQQSASSMPDIKGLNKALSQRHERQKVMLGRLLNEFHQLAEEAKKQEAKAEAVMDDDDDDDEIQLSSMAHLRRVTTKSEEVRVEEETPKNVIKLEDDISELGPKKIWELIGRIRDGDILQREDLKRINSAAASKILEDPTVIDLRDRKDLKQITVVGDLHGHFNSLYDVLGLVGDHESAEAGSGTPWDGSGAVVFNGDFVDRGANSLEVILTLLLLKLAYPDHIYLNRGNHEDGILSTVYGYNDELKSRYESSDIDDIWDSFTEVFASLPLCVRTETSIVMHGGIPSDGFQLTELEAITPEMRSRITSTLEPGDDAVCQLIQGVLWSDPRPEDGVHPNEDRGAGMCFGPDILRRFLREHGAKHFIRSHEPVDAGYEYLECSEEQSVVTVFSASSYPNGEGYNWGAVIRLRADGSFEPVPFPGENHNKKEEQQAEFGKRTFSALAEVIVQNRAKLADEFASMAATSQYRQKFGSTGDAQGPATLLTREQWADCMAFVLDLPGLDWISLQPYLAPTMLADEKPEGTAVNLKRKTSADSGMIDYTRFLEMHCNVVPGGMEDVDPATMDMLLENHSMLLTVFKFLDTDGNGSVDREEFREGMKLLRKRFPQNNLQDPDAIFDSIDVDGSGEIDLDEFEKAFQVVDMPYDMAVFKLFDTDRSGTIDRDEFREGLKMLNQRLPENERLGDADEIFNNIDTDGSGEIDLEELRTALKTFFPSM